MGSIRRNSFYNDPAIGQAFNNLAGLFGPPKATDVYAYAKARQVRDEADRTAAGYTALADSLTPEQLAGVQAMGPDYLKQFPAFDTYRHAQKTSDPKTLDPLVYAIFGNAKNTFAGAREGEAAATGRTQIEQAGAMDRQRYSSDSTAETTLRTNAADNVTKTDVALMNPIARDAVQYIPPGIAAANNVPTVRRGNISLAQGETVVPGDGGAPLVGQEKPLTRSEYDAQQADRLRRSGQITDQMLVDAITGRQPPVRAIGRGGKPIFTTPGAATRLGLEPAPTSPSSVVNVNRGENAFESEVGKAEAKAFQEMSSDAVAANEDKGQIQDLRDNLSKLPGGPTTAMQALASRFGIKLGANVSNLEAAQATLARMIPKQRVAGSGTTSDRDAQNFREGLPQILNTPGGNELVMRTLESAADYRIEQGKIATKVLNGKMTREEGRNALQALPSPFAAFHKPDGASAGTPREASIGAPAVREGATATNPTTGEKVIFRNGAWEPL